MSCFKNNKYRSDTGTLQFSWSPALRPLSVDVTPIFRSRADCEKYTLPRLNLKWFWRLVRCTLHACMCMHVLTSTCTFTNKWGVNPHGRSDHQPAERSPAARAAYPNASHSTDPGVNCTAMSGFVRGDIPGVTRTLFTH